MNIDRALSIAKQSKHQALRDLAGEVEAQMVAETPSATLSYAATQTLAELKRRFAKVSE